MKKVAIRLLKFAVSAAILSVLIYNAQDQLLKIGTGEKRWHFLALGLCLVLNSTLICHLRWFCLVRALGIPIRLWDAFRLGFLGYALNYASLGSVGGDVFKAIFLAREQPDHKAEAVATVLVDRLIGLYALFVVASVAVLIGGLHRSALQSVALTAAVTLTVTALSTVAGAVLILPFGRHKRGNWLAPTGGFAAAPIAGGAGPMANAAPAGFPAVRSPQHGRVGKFGTRFLRAVQMYRRNPGVVLFTTVMSFGVHSSTALAVYCLAQGLWLRTPAGVSLELPSLGQHFLIVPLAILAGAAPLPAAGLGAFEGALVVLYSLFLSTPALAADAGTPVSLMYRAVTIIIAIIGFCYYLANRALVRQLMVRAATEEEELEAELDAESSQAA